MLFKEIVDGRTHARTDEGRRTLKDHKTHLSTLCSGELKTQIFKTPFRKNKTMHFFQNLNILLLNFSEIIKFLMTLFFHNMSHLICFWPYMYRDT